MLLENQMSVSSSDSVPDTLVIPHLQSTTEAFEDDDFDLGTSIFSKSKSQPGQLKSSSKQLQDSLTYKSARLSNGATVHLKKKLPKLPSDVEFHNLRPQNGNSRDSTENVDTRNHYGIPIHKLLSQVEEQVLYDNQVKSRPTPPPPSTQPLKSHGLLCERWRPKKWVDLLGPEKTHRQLLKWLLCWSSAVFKTDPLVNASKLGNNGGNELYSDPLDRPQRRILLIHGPPGIGKTTVAHVIAKHAGYDILEINASDERSGPLVKDKIKSAVATHRVGGNPVCIIADEIEGAAESGFIRALVDIINADARATQLLKQGVKPGALNNKSTRGAQLLMRPIIAICNDAYAPSLRTLRPLAEVVSYRRVSPSIIADKLQAVCSVEGIRVDNRILTQIANETESDMRSCLNILQFGINPIDLPSVLASSRPSEKSNTTGSSGLGQRPEFSIKDREKSWTSVVNRIFRRNRGFNNKTEESEAVLTDIHSCGDYDRIMSSCFTMYPEMQFHDDMFRKPVRFGDWLYFHDMINRGIYTLQHGALAEYHGYAPLACFSYFSSYSNVAKGGKQMIVKTGLEHRESMRMNEQLRDEFIQFTSPISRQAFNKSEVSSELIPYLAKFVNPSLESSSNTGGGSKKAAVNAKLSHLVQVLMDYNLSFQLRAVEKDGANVYVLNPPIETLAVFGEKDLAHVRHGQYSVRHALFNELTKAKFMVRANEGHWTVKKYKASDPEARELLSKGNSDKDARGGKRKLDEVQAQRSSSIKQAPVDPFHRFKIRKVVSETDDDPDKKEKEDISQDSAEPDQDSQLSQTKNIWVQFNEGVSNAVRRNLTWRDVWA